uniref:Ion_trans_2 domain-containing protein n=1 Tax=Heterorhabditis bacteriophora TaxID=37862 RepID=A0A1I7XV34_HETBA
MVLCFGVLTYPKSEDGWRISDVLVFRKAMSIVSFEQLELDCLDASEIRSLRGFRTDFSNYLASDTDFLTVASIVTNYAYGESSNDNDKDIQCDLLTEDSGHEVDPTRLSYKIIWIILLSGCAVAFVYQAIAVVDKYARMDKITDIQLKFDTG